MSGAREEYSFNYIKEQAELLAKAERARKIKERAIALKQKQVEKAEKQKIIAQKKNELAKAKAIEAKRAEILRKKKEAQREMERKQIELALINHQIDIIVGTHTHVQTADERILPQGTAYITDLGMCGPINSVLGVKTDRIIEKLLTNMPVRFDISDNPIQANGLLVTLDSKYKPINALIRQSGLV